VDVVPVPQLQDNYAYLIVDPASREAAVVDCAEAAPVLQAARQAGARLTTVLATHHHYDHVGGNDDLRAAIPDVRIFGSAEDAPRIPGITNPVRDGETVTVGGLAARVIFIPAHTSGHVAYYFEKVSAVSRATRSSPAAAVASSKADAAQMMSSLGRLAKLPEATRVSAGRVTQKNLDSVSLEPGNTAGRGQAAHSAPPGGTKADHSEHDRRGEGDESLLADVERRAGELGSGESARFGHRTTRSRSSPPSAH